MSPPLVMPLHTACTVSRKYEINLVFSVRDETQIWKCLGSVVLHKVANLPGKFF